MRPPMGERDTFPYKKSGSSGADGPIHSCLRDSAGWLQCGQADSPLDLPKTRIRVQADEGGVDGQVDEARIPFFHSTLQTFEGVFVVAHFDVKHRVAFLVRAERSLTGRGAYAGSAALNGA